MKIIPLGEGRFTIDKTKEFVPFDDDKHELNDRPTGSLLVEIQPFLVITSRDHLLLDTGLGFEVNGELQVHTNLKKAGIEPSAITRVLISHLHKDHAGGILDKSGKPAFPNAEYYIQKEEWEEAINKGRPSYYPGEFRDLEKSGQLRFLEGNGSLEEYIRYEITGAHSRYHQVYWIEEEEEIIFFGADDAPQMQQMKHRFVAKYDLDGKKAASLRQEWWETGRKQHWRFLFYHDIQTPVCNS